MRAITGADNVLDSATDGLVPDVTPPNTHVTSFGTPVDGAEDNQSTGVVYQRDVESVLGAWETEELQSEMRDVSITVGNVPGMQVEK